MNIMQLLELELVNFQLWGMKIPFTRAHKAISEKHKKFLENHMGSL